MSRMAMPFQWLGRYLLPEELQEARLWAERLPQQELSRATYNEWPVAEWITSSVHTFFRRSRLDFTDQEVQKVFRSFLASGLVACFGLERLLASYEPDLLLLFNGRLSSTRVALELAKRRGIRVVGHERGRTKDALRLFENSHCIDLQPIRQAWKEWGNIPLSREQLEKTHQFLVDRAHGKNSSWRPFSPPPQDPDEVRRLLNLTPHRPLWVLFTSSDDEVASASEWQGPFARQFDWLVTTVAFAARHPEIDLVIRVHPNTGGEKALSDNKVQLREMEELNRQLPANVRMVMPDDPVSSYSLMDMATVGLVFHSFTGLEMACRGKTVVVAAGCPFQGLPFVHTVTKASGYEELLEDLLKKASPVSSRQIQRLAYRFAYIWAYRLNISFPLVTMSDHITGHLAYHDLEELTPGKEENLDRVCRIILDNEPVCPPPTARDRAASEQDELEWFGISPEVQAGEGTPTKLADNSGNCPGASLIPQAPRQESTWQTQIVISVIIPTYNRKEVLLKCLETLANQTYPREFYEVLVCDDGSTDDTRKAVENFAAPYQLIYLRQENRGPAAARNLGIRQARGEYILILNDDTLASPELLEKHVETHRRLHSQKIAVLGSCPFSDSLITSPIMALLQNSTCYFAYSDMEPHQYYDFRYFWTCNISLPRQAVIQIGLFDEDFPEAAWEDVELGYRLAHQGYAIYYEPACRAEHYHKMDFYGFIRRQIMIDRNAVLLLHKHPELTNWFQLLKDFENAEEKLIKWLKNHEPVVLGLMEVVQDLDSLGKEDPQLIEGLRHALNRLVPMVFQYWTYQGFLEGLARYVYSRPEAASSLRLTFVVPGTSLFHGFKTVVEYANRLARMGHRVTITTLTGDLPHWCHLDPGVTFITSPLEEDRLPHDVPEGDAVFATNWLSAFFVSRLPWSKGEKFYLVQEYESTTVALPAQADPSYLLPLQKIVVSSGLAQLLKRTFGQKSVVIPLGIETSLFYPRPEVRERYPDAGLRLGMFYHPSASKSMADGFAAFHLIKKVHPTARLILFSPVAPTEELPCDELHINLQGEELREYLNSLDLFLSCSSLEGFELSGLEALACGIPLVTTDCGGVRDYALPEKTALVCPPGNPRALAEAALRVLADQDLRRHLRTQGLTLVQEFKWEKSVAQLVQIVQQTLASRSRKRSTRAARQERRLRVGYLTTEPEHHPSPHVRLHAPLSLLADQGHIEILPLHWLDQGNLTPNLANLLRADIIIVQGLVPVFLPWEKLRKELMNEAVRLVYEIDEAFTHLPATFGENLISEEHKSAIEEFIRRADLVTVASAGLQALYRHLNPNIVVLPDCLDTQIWPELPERSRPVVSPIRLLVHVSSTHAREMAVLEEVVSSLVLELGAQVEFLFWGDPSPRLQGLPQVKALKQVPLSYAEYASLVRSLEADGALVFLEDHDFNRGKSPILWLEYSACRIPGIYSRIGSYAAVIKSGETGLLVMNTYEDWYQAVKKMVSDGEFRAALGRKAYEEVRRQHTIQKNAHLWLETYQRLSVGPQSGKEGTRVETSIIIPVFNNLEYTRSCLESVYKHTAEGVRNYEIIVVDNGSTDGSAEYLRQEEKRGRLRLVSNSHNLGFAKACNQGAREARGDYLVFLNNDTIVQSGWLAALIRALEKEENIGIVGGKLLYPDGTIQHAGVSFTNQDNMIKVLHIYQGFYKTHPAVNKIREFQAVTGACMIIRKSLFYAVGGFDENYQNGFEDLDLCFKVRQLGYKIIYTPHCVVYHLEGKTPGRYAKEAENSFYFISRWKGQLKPDKLDYYKEDEISTRLWKYDKNGNPIYILHDNAVTTLRQEARSYKQQGFYPKAVEKYKTALLINPEDNRHLLIAAELAETYQMIGRDNEALEIYRALVNRSPLPHYQYKLARLERKLGYLREAVNNLETAKAVLNKGVPRGRALTYGRHRKIKKVVESDLGDTLNSLLGA